MFNRRFVTPLLLLMALLTSSAWTKTGNDFPVNQILPAVKCEKDPSFSYALYLPPGYSSDRSWPVIWCFSPRGDGITPVTFLRDVAAEHGYILIGSNDSRNGPYKAIDNAINAMMTDAESRLALDPVRQYSMGLSGASRVSLDLALQHPERFAGVILTGGVFSSRRPFSGSSSLAMIGIVGDGDLALAEHLQAEELMAHESHIRWLEIFPGAHHWPTKKLLTEAVELLHVDAMLHERIPRDEAFLKRVVADHLAAAQRMKKEGRPLLAQRTYEQTGRLLSGIKGSKRADKQAQAIKQSTEFANASADEKRFVEEITILTNPYDDEEFARVIKALQTRMAGDSLFSDRARNALHLRAIFINMTASELINQGDLATASDFYLTAQLLYPEAPAAAYNAACLYARSGDSTNAMAMLKDAADNLFNNINLLRTDPDLESLRELEGFSEIEQAVRNNHTLGLTPPPYPH